jgi:hypothetical protein
MGGAAAQEGSPKRSQPLDRRARNAFLSFFSSLLFLSPELEK